MKRDLKRLSTNHYDLLVVGGGINGACIAWDATLRGLSVALIEKADFGHATSANSMKTVHGGLRYLQDGDLPLVREMIRERSAILRIAPHLVRPLPCVMPTYSHLTHSRALLGAAILLSDLIGFDRNRHEYPQQYLPNGRVIGREECLSLLPGIVAKGLTGGVVWHDAQVQNTERLVLSFLLSAAQAGAELANYVEATGFLTAGRRVVGIRARDALTGQEMELRARLVLTAAGPWTTELLNGLSGQPVCWKVPLSVAVNLVIPQLNTTYAMGLPTRSGYGGDGGKPDKKSRTLFFAPWRGYTIAGTAHLPIVGDSNEPRATEEAVLELVDEVRGAFPAAGLRREDVTFLHSGLLPAGDGRGPREVSLLRKGMVRDHREHGGVEGLVSVVGVKYTAARKLAQGAVDLACKKLGRGNPKCRTDTLPLYGGQIGHLGDFIAGAMAVAPSGLSQDIVSHLVHTYGSEYRTILSYLESDPGAGLPVGDSTNVIRAEVLHAVRCEMAQRLSDVTLRRTDLGTACRPGEPTISACAHIMAQELGWSHERMQREIGEVRDTYASLGV